MSGVERVLGEVAEAAEPLIPVNEWTVSNQIIEQVERMRTWDRGFMRPSVHRVNLRQVLVGLAALCVAAIVALDAPAAGGGR